MRCDLGGLDVVHAWQGQLLAGKCNQVWARGGKGLVPSPSLPKTAVPGGWSGPALYSHPKHLAVVTLVLLQAGLQCIHGARALNFDQRLGLQQWEWSGGGSCHRAAWMETGTGHPGSTPVQTPPRASAHLRVHPRLGLAHAKLHAGIRMNGHVAAASFLCSNGRAGHVRVRQPCLPAHLPCTTRPADRVMRPEPTPARSMSVRCQPPASRAS